jgi:hypothetical protein
MEALPEPKQEREFYRKGSAILTTVLACLRRWHGETSRRCIRLCRQRNTTACATVCSTVSAIFQFLFLALSVSLAAALEGTVPVLGMDAHGYNALLSLLWDQRYRIPTIDPILMLGSGVCLAALLGRYRHARRCQNVAP